jgi:hypothetical protein
MLGAAGFGSLRERHPNSEQSGDRRRRIRQPSPRERRLRFGSKHQPPVPIPQPRQAPPAPAGTLALCASPNYVIFVIPYIDLALSDKTTYMPTPTAPVPSEVKRALERLGADVSEARRRRRLPMEVVADRALTTRQTVARIERGDPRVAIGTWASVLFALGLANRLGELAAPTSDREGLALEAERLPKRVRVPRSERRSS